MWSKKQMAHIQKKGPAGKGDGNWKPTTHVMEGTTSSTFEGLSPPSSREDSAPCYATYTPSQNLFLQLLPANYEAHYWVSHRNCFYWPLHIQPT